MQYVDTERITLPRSLIEVISRFLIFYFFTVHVKKIKTVFLPFGIKSGINIKEAYLKKTVIIFIKKGFVLRLKGKNRFIV